MADSKERKISKGKLRAIIIASVSAVIVLAILITNIFIPVKYILSYMVLRNKGAEEGVMRLTFVDVGYGDCLIVELPDGKNMLIDSGKNREGTILKYLNKYDIDELDYVICTSVNSEHCGGFGEILKYKPPKQVYFPFCENMRITDEYANFIYSLRGTEASLKFCERGQAISGEGYSLTFLSPSPHTDENSEYNKLYNKNLSEDDINSSCAVMWLEYGETRILLTSNIYYEVLEKVCNRYASETSGIDLSECDILQLPYHGHYSSAQTRLYELTKPSVAVVSVGDNAKGCPSVQAINSAVSYVGEKLYRTDEDGTVVIEITDKGYEIKI